MNSQKNNEAMKINTESVSFTYEHNVQVQVQTESRTIELPHYRKNPDEDHTGDDSYVFVDKECNMTIIEFFDCGQTVCVSSDKLKGFNHKDQLEGYYTPITKEEFETQLVNAIAMLLPKNSADPFASLLNNIPKSTEEQ
ncbi:hypothetical protein [Vibrio sp. D431a]|uniref:hypothetical protein n=1 Tax=Vibrio sp. D431a TaxID=2837388 RepID=UPI002554F7B5|nr:hypothetical protein [Vibrio sp. D431a]MDK9790033.1 hypothetical protein [Vibrio sp. D431a]